MGKHAELIKAMNISRNEYLRALRKEQPIEELKRKADKSCRHKNKIWTQEQIDYQVALSIELLPKFMSLEFDV